MSVALAVAPELVPVEEVRPGDEVVVLSTGRYVVSEVKEYRGDVFTIIYFKHVEETWENKAQLHGRRRHNRLVEKFMRPMERGELVETYRGDEARAEKLREQVQRRWLKSLEEA